MTLEFKPLPMTELRTRPGEILDRVADGGESFVIERNGRQKACLVPLSVFLPDISAARIAYELDQIEKAGEKSRTTITPNKEVAIRLQCVIGEEYEVTVLLPHNYPNTCPRVYADPVISDAPHRFSDGALCIFGMTSTWNPAKHTVTDAIDNAHRWLKHYEIWRTTDKWPKPERVDAE